MFRVSLPLDVILCLANTFRGLYDLQCLALALLLDLEAYSFSLSSQMSVAGGSVET
jgi:hypothetical protein